MLALFASRVRQECTLNEAESVSLRAGLRVCVKLGIYNINVEGDSLYDIRWAASSSKPPWHLVDVMEEVIELALKLNVSFVLLLCSANEEVDLLAKESGSHLFLHQCPLGFYAFAFWIVVFCLFFLCLSCSY